jgi:hypothetical protein
VLVNESECELALSRHYGTRYTFSKHGVTTAPTDFHVEKCLEQWLSAPGGSMHRVRIARNCVKEPRPASADWTTDRAMTWFRNHQKSALKDMHLFDSLADPVGLREQLDTHPVFLMGLIH